MTEFIISLSIAAISALAFLAYKHPVGFIKIYNVLMILNFVIYIVINVWNEGVHKGQTNIVNVVYQSKPTMEMIDAIGKYQKESSDSAFYGYVGLVFVGVFVYLIILRYIVPEIKGDKGNKVGD